MRIYVVVTCGYRRYIPTQHQPAWRGPRGIPSFGAPVTKPNSPNLSVPAKTPPQDEHEAHLTRTSRLPAYLPTRRPATARARRGFRPRAARRPPHPPAMRGGRPSRTARAGAPTRSGAVKSASALWRRLAQAPEAVAGRPVARASLWKCRAAQSCQARLEEVLLQGAQGASWGALTAKGGNNSLTMRAHTPRLPSERRAPQREEPPADAPQVGRCGEMHLYVCINIR